MTDTGGTPLVPPAETRPRCKRCDGEWNGTSLLLCDRCYEHELDELERDDALADLRETDRELRW